MPFQQSLCAIHPGFNRYDRTGNDGFSQGTSLSSFCAQNLARVAISREETHESHPVRRMDLISIALICSHCLVFDQGLPKLECVTIDWSKAKSDARAKAGASLQIEFVKRPNALPPLSGANRVGVCAGEGNGNAVWSAQSARNEPLEHTHAMVA
jgi:hypothetical protein